MNKRTPIIAGLVDALAIIVFVAIGRRNHDEGVAAAGVIDTAAPFLIALVVGWIASRAWREPLAARTGLIVWVTTVAIGMVLRKVAFDGGTATAFVIVATLFNAATLNGWRLAVRARAARITTDS
jgi:hypothetical protein